MKDSSQPTKFKYFLTDHLGSISVVLDANGGILEQQRYYPFGQPRPLQNYTTISLTDFTYTGQRTIPDTGLMDYKARFYSPYINRFLQPDSIIPDLSNPQSLNRYSYTLNNPINYNDPDGHDGHCPECAAPLLIIPGAAEVSLVALAVVAIVWLEIDNNRMASEALADLMASGKSTPIGGNLNKNVSPSQMNVYPSDPGNRNPWDPEKNKPDRSNLTKGAKGVGDIASSGSKWAKILAFLLSGGMILAPNPEGNPSPIKNAFIPPTPVDLPTQVATPTLILAPTQVLTGTKLPTRTLTKAPTPTYIPTNTPTSTPTYVPGIPARRFRGYLDPE